MLRLGRALLGRLRPARPWAARRGAAAAAGGEEERFVFLEYEPEPPPPPLLPPPPPPAASARGREAVRSRAAGRDGAREGDRVRGVADLSVPPSGVGCSGCGAELQCRDAAAPGFVPADKYRSLCAGPDGTAGLRDAVCQRCWVLEHGGRVVRLDLPPEQHRAVLSAALRSPPRHGRGPLLLYLLDVLELPDPVLPQLPALLSPEVPAAGLLVVGNKVDLLPADSPGHLGRLRQRVTAACLQAGISRAQLVDVRLVSAKTGFGIERLVSRLQRSWKCAGDVYLLGATNSGKSTLFNALLLSDYCKSRAPDVVNRATVSSWPGEGHVPVSRSGCQLLCARPVAKRARGITAVGGELQHCTVLGILPFPVLSLEALRHQGLRALREMDGMQHVLASPRKSCVQGRAMEL